jgi:hypothetical protein
MSHVSHPLAVTQSRHVGEQRIDFRKERRAGEGRPRTVKRRTVKRRTEKRRTEKRRRVAVFVFLSIVFLSAPVHFIAESKILPPQKTTLAIII